MAFLYDVVQAAAITGGGPTQQFKSTVFANTSPKAAMFLIGRGTSNGTITPSLCIACGFAVSSSSRNFSSIQSEDNSWKSDCGKTGYNDQCLHIQLDNGSVDGEADLVEFSNDATHGWAEVTWGNLPAAGYFVEVHLFGGSDVTDAAVDIINSTSGDDTQSLGFEPNLILASSIRSSYNDSHQTTMQFNFGACSNYDSTVKQACWAWYEQTNVQGGNPTGAIVSDRICRGIDSTPTLGGSIECKTFTSSGFVGSQGHTTGNRATYLALKITNHAVSVDQIDGPTSASNKSYTSPGFKPGTVIAFMSTLEAVDTAKADSTVGGFSIGGATASDGEYCIGGHIENVSPGNSTNTGSKTNTKLIDCPAHDGGTTDDVRCALDSFDANGLTLAVEEYSSAAHKGFMVTVEEDAGGATDETTTLATGARVKADQSTTLATGGRVKSDVTTTLATGARLQTTPTQTLDTGARVLADQTEPLDTGARIVADQIETLATGARVATVTDETTTLDTGARVETSPTTTIDTGARVEADKTTTLDTGGRVKADQSTTLATGGRVQTTPTETLLTGSRVKADQTFGLATGVRLQGLPTDETTDLLTGARVVADQTETLATGSRVQFDVTEALPTGARVQKVPTTTLDTGARLVADQTFGLATGARVDTGEDKTTTLDTGARVVADQTTTLDTGGRIQTEETVDLLAGARLQTAPTVTLATGAKLLAANTFALATGARVSGAAPPERRLELSSLITKSHTLSSLITKTHNLSSRAD